MGTLSVDKILKTSTGAAEFTLPAADGTVGQVMQTDGSGQLSIAALAADTVGTSQISALAVDTAEIAANAVDGTKIAMGSDTIGDMLYYNGTDYVRLAAGTADQLLTSAGAAAPTWAAAAGGGKIGQVVSTTKTDTFSSASATWVDLTGMSVAITPAATSSKILILITLGSFVSDGNNARAQGQLLRGSTAIAIGDAATGEECTWAFCGRTNAGAYHQFSASASFLDSPSTTSATTYKLQVQRGPDAAGTVWVNREGTLDANGGNTVSTITVMEVLA